MRQIRKQYATLLGNWNKDREILNEIKILKEKISQSQLDFERYSDIGDFAKASEIKYGILPELQKQLAQKSTTANAILQPTMTERDIALVLSKKTGIPLENLTSKVHVNLENIEAKLSKRVIGQEKAIKSVANAVRRSKSGMGDPKRPIGSFLFLGPTGVGKTELCKALAEFLFFDETAMVRIDMSEFMERHSVSNLIGAPAGYIGYENEGALTRSVRKRPYQVVLFDEIEKAHPDVLNLLLPLLDEGHITDNQGKVVNFKNTIIVMTSNIGAELFMHETGETLEKDVISTAKRTLKPEIYNRIDDVVVFNSLTPQAVAEIVNLQLLELKAKLEKRDLTLDFSEEVVEWLAKVGFDPQYGARPIKRTIDGYVTNAIAQELVTKEIGQKQTVKLFLLNGKLNIDFN